MLPLIDYKNQAVSIIASCNPQSPIELPTLQILIKKKGNTFVGEALDFRFNGYSNKEKIENAIKDIFGQISSLVILDMTKRLTEGSIDQLYANSNPLGDKWDEYLNIVRHYRIKKIKESYKKLISNLDLDQIKEENKKEIEKKFIESSEYNIEKIQEVA